MKWRNRMNNDFTLEEMIYINANSEEGLEKEEKNHAKFKVELCDCQ